MVNMMSLDIMSDVMSLKGMVDIISLARLRHIIRHTIAAEVCLTRPAARGKRGADTQPPATQALVIPSITRAQQTGALSLSLSLSHSLSLSLSLSLQVSQELNKQPAKPRSSRLTVQHTRRTAEEFASCYAR